MRRHSFSLENFVGNTIMEIGTPLALSRSSSAMRSSARSSGNARTSKQYSPTIEIPSSPATTENSDRGDESPTNSIDGAGHKRASTKRQSAYAAQYCKPLTPRAKLSLAALQRVIEVRIYHTVKHENGPAYVLEVVLSGNDARLRIHHSARSFKEFKKLQHAVCHWAEKHDPQEPTCPHCFQFVTPFARQIWPGPVAYNLVPTSKMQLILCSRINDYVRQSRGDHHERSATCKGYTHILTIVAGFVFKDIDLATI